VVGIYHTGLYEFDSSVVYMTLDASRAFLNVPDGAASGIEVRSTDITEADLLAADVRTALMAEAATGVQVRDWKELNRNLFAALKLEKLAMSFVLLFIVVVASFAVFSVLVMIVLRRRDEIAILRAMGASQRAIRNVFIVQGMAIGASGTALGLAVSGAAVWVLVSIGVPLDAEVYYIDRLPVDVQGFEIAVIALGSLLISLVATIPPSVQAARLDPAQGLRHE
jgi:lipoprotein-releasing system permease protein